MSPSTTTTTHHWVSRVYNIGLGLPHQPLGLLFLAFVSLANFPQWTQATITPLGFQGTGATFNWPLRCGRCLLLSCS